MKKTIYLALLLSIFNMVSGQDWDMKLGASSAALKFNKSNVVQKSMFIGASEGGVVLLRYQDSKTEEPYLVSYNIDLVEQNVEMLPFDKKQTYHVGYLNGDEIDLVQTYVENGNFVVNHLIYDANTLKLKQTEQLAAHEYNAQCSFFVKESQTKKSVATVFLYVTNSGAQCMVASYNRMIEENWNIDYYTDLFDDFVVTDDGKVAILGSGTIKGASKTHLKFSLLSNGKEEIYEADKSIGDVFRLRLLGYGDGMFYCTGLIKSEHWAENSHYDFASGYFTLAYDSNSKSISAYNVHNMTKDELCSIANIPTNKFGNEDIQLSKLFVVSSCVDEDGAIFVLQCTYDLYYYASFDRTIYDGFYLVRLAKDGNLEWSKVIRHSSAAVGNKLRAATKFRLVKTGDTYNLFYLEKQKNLTLPGTRMYDQLYMGRGQFDMQVLTIDRNGNYTRKFFPLVKNSIILGSPYLMENGKCLMLLSQSNGSNTAILDPKK
ncbi:MAG: hypothetical protein J6X58_05855 [Bacteroidales bacterium]|nr:hypothetical protein [Bacteroidales bacterium]